MPGSVDEFSNAMLGIPEFRARGGILRGLFYLGRTLRQLVRRKTRGCVVPLQGTWAHPGHVRMPNLAQERYCFPTLHDCSVT